MLEFVEARRSEGVTVALIGLMTLAAFVAFGAVTGADDGATRAAG